MKISIMNTMNRHKGFTIVEIIIVIVAIAILASIVVVSYNFARDDAMDAKIRSTVKTSGEAIALHESQTGSRITGQGLFSTTNGVDSLVPTYLKENYRTGLQSTNATSAVNILRWYSCTNADGGFVVYASLSAPTDEDTTAFSAARTTCGHGNTQAPTSGDPQYNYAQIF